MPDSDDNCPDTANPDQQDTDGFTERVIIEAPEVQDPDSVFAADLDGDGDNDVIVASSENEPDPIGVLWFENTDGAGTFGPPNAALPRLNLAYSVVAADMDLDQDLDLVVGTYHSMSWCENTDGASIFGQRDVVDVRALQVVTADVDGDGDTDIVRRDYLNEVTWFENIDGSGSLGPSRVVTDSGATSIFAADIDGNGTVDVVSTGDDDLFWNSNLDGNGTFGPDRPIPHQLDNGSSVFAVDVDRDGDVLTASRDDGRVAWYENTAGNGQLWIPRNISTSATGASSVFAADLNGDGYPDAISASSDIHTIAWYESIGDGDSCDCAPSDPLTHRPRDVEGLNLLRLGSTTVQLVWGETPGADSYSVTRGVLSEIGIGEFGECLVQDLPDEVYDDDDVPAAGSGNGYLVKGTSNACGPGTLGFGNGGIERVNDDPQACP